MEKDTILTLKVGNEYLEDVSPTVREKDYELNFDIPKMIKFILDNVNFKEPKIPDISIPFVDVNLNVNISWWVIFPTGGVTEMFNYPKNKYIVLDSIANIHAIFPTAYMVGNSVVYGTEWTIGMLGDFFHSTISCATNSKISNFVMLLQDRTIIEAMKKAAKFFYSLINDSEWYNYLKDNNSVEIGKFLKNVYTGLETFTQILENKDKINFNDYLSKIGTGDITVALLSILSFALSEGLTALGERLVGSGILTIGTGIGSLLGIFEVLLGLGLIYLSIPTDSTVMDLINDWMEWRKTNGNDFNSFIEFLKNKIDFSNPDNIWKDFVNNVLSAGGLLDFFKNNGFNPEDFNNFYNELLNYSPLPTDFGTGMISTSFVNIIDIGYSLWDITNSWLPWWRTYRFISLYSTGGNLGYKAYIVNAGADGDLILAGEFNIDDLNWLNSNSPPIYIAIFKKGEEPPFFGSLYAYINYLLNEKVSPIMDEIDSLLNQIFTLFNEYMDIFTQYMNDYIELQVIYTEFQVMNEVYEEMKSALNELKETINSIKVPSFVYDDIAKDINSLISQFMNSVLDIQSSVSKIVSKFEAIKNEYNTLYQQLQDLASQIDELNQKLQQYNGMRIDINVNLMIAAPILVKLYAEMFGIQMIKIGKVDGLINIDR